MPKFYGIHSWTVWNRTAAQYLRDTRRSPKADWLSNDLVEISSFEDLFNLVAFLNVMNKRQILVFRGQASDRAPVPTLLRDAWHPPWTSATVDLRKHRKRVWKRLDEVASRVACVLKGKLPRHRPFDAFVREPRLRVAPWSVIQHYELWPTPMLDLTASLRVAASFALGLDRPAEAPSVARQGFLYVFALETKPLSDVMSLATAAIGLNRSETIRLSAVCPPATRRPHLQEGLLFGNPEFSGGNLADERSPLCDRLVAKFQLIDDASIKGGFWSSDFPAHTPTSLLPEEEMQRALIAEVRHDELLK
jgi:FRG domain